MTGQGEASTIHGKPEDDGTGKANRPEGNSNETGKR